LLQDARRKLASAGVVNDAAEAEWLLESAVGSTRSQLVTLDPLIEPAAVERLRGLVERRMSGEPLQYITGVAGFRHLELAVGPGVFIPRPETELVVERALTRIPSQGTVVDVGTGSGAIALSIAQERPDARVLATEVSGDALEWATKNRDGLGLDVELYHGDLLEPLPEELRGRIDVVVSNMPYVPDEDAALLPADVVRHEPRVALFGAPGGLALIERLAGDARAGLRPGGWLVLEIGDRQGDRVLALLGALGYAEATVHLDYAARERIVDATVPSGDAK
jgi:release factor glutamine methyltransferase